MGITKQEVESYVSQIMDASEALNNASGALISYLQCKTELNDVFFETISEIEDGSYDDLEEAAEAIMNSITTA